MANYSEPCILNLTPITIKIDLKNTLSKQNKRVNILANFTVGILTELAVLQNAIKRLIGLEQSEIKLLATDIIFGQLKQIVANMDIEEITGDMEKFSNNISTEIEYQLSKIGLKLININIMN